jgi:glucosamine 6-phosphate synthetase-like amidotransferase/phosphosugar isomerase protein
MCQLAAYIGDRPIASLLLRAIEHQEAYIGGYATGLGVLDDGVLKVEKDVGHVRKAISTTEISKLKGTTGISHSRHTGKARDDPRHNTKEKAHPFVDGTGTLALMHNGTLYNYRELWQDLRNRHEFSSYSEDVDDITDSEVAVHILREALDAGESMEEAIRFLAKAVKGEFLFGVISTEHPETIWIANWAQPCVLALNDDEAMFVSSPIGFYDVREEFDRVFTPPWNSLMKLTRGRVEISTLDPSRRVPRLNIDGNSLAQSILAALKRHGKMEIRNLGKALNPDSMAAAYGVSADTFSRYYKEEHVRPNNDFFGVLDMLVRDGMILEEISLIWEAGVPDMPKFFYSLP